MRGRNDEGKERRDSEDVGQREEGWREVAKRSGVEDVKQWGCGEEAKGQLWF